MALLLVVLTPGTRCPADDTLTQVAAARGMPVIEDFHYRVSGAIRPLLFWIRDNDVGGARIILRGDGRSRSAYEFLIGSDPRRTPRGINRWGWVWEERREDGATQIGLMRRIDEQSFKEAEAKAGHDGDYVFKANRTEISGDRARSENTVWRVRDNYTFYDLDQILQVIAEPPQNAPQVNEGPIPPGTHPGLLFALDDLVDRAVAAAREEPRVLLAGVSANYNFNTFVCEMRLRRTEWEESEEYGGRRYERLVRLEFESYDARHRAGSQFTLVCGTEGRWKGVPVYMRYQPKWWFRVEGVFDESQVFERPREPSLQSQLGVPEGTH